MQLVIDDTFIADKTNAMQHVEGLWPNEAFLDVRNRKNRCGV